MYLIILKKGIYQDLNNNIISVVEDLNFKKSIFSNKMFSDFLEGPYGPRKKKAPLYVLYHNKDQLFELIVTSYYTLKKYNFYLLKY